MNRKCDVVLIVIITFLAGGCATGSGGGLTERESGALLGGGIGAGTGAIIGHQTGHAGAGTAIGAGVGALTGAFAGEGMRRTKEQAKQEIREESMAQQAQPGLSYSQVPATAAEVHTKYNPRTGQTFPASYEYDPNTSEKLEYIKK